jgi:hypothetical protein
MKHVPAKFNLLPIPTPTLDYCSPFSQVKKWQKLFPSKLCFFAKMTKKNLTVDFIPPFSDL